MPRIENNPSLDDDLVIARRPLRKRVLICSSDEDNIFLEKKTVSFDEISLETNDFQRFSSFECQETSYYKVHLVEQNKTINCKLNVSENLLALNLLQEITKNSDSHNTNNDYSIFILDAKNSLIFPFMELHHLHLENTCIDCYSVENLAPLNIYIKICDVLKTKRQQSVVRYFSESQNNEKFCPNILNFYADCYHF
ncbi:hypothetical protein MXB_5585 [Myxobolus squamalis]|nr:hypothetical protein MXB_5585 [Myxobolus squamalis]